MLKGIQDAKGMSFNMFLVAGAFQLCIIILALLFELLGCDCKKAETSKPDPVLYPRSQSKYIETHTRSCKLYRDKTLCVIKK